MEFLVVQPWQAVLHVFLSLGPPRVLSLSFSLLDAFVWGCMIVIIALL
jgi:hypothetical protein